MSINFKRDNGVRLKISEDISEFIYDNESMNKIELFAHHLLKTFDEHYLKYIFFRKHRDLLIINECMNYLISDVRFCKEKIKSYKLGDYFKVDGERIAKNDDVLSFDTCETIICIENEISILKAFDIFFSDLVRKYSILKNTLNVSVKMNKVRTLSDHSIICELTKNIEIQKTILSKIKGVKTFDNIPVNSSFYKRLKEESRLIIPNN